MDHDKSMVIRSTDPILMPATFSDMMTVADVLVKSGFLPESVKTPAQAAAIMIAGRELGFSVMQSFRCIYIVKGKPAMSAQSMGAKIKAAGHYYHVDELSNERCQITFRRTGSPAPYTHTFTMDDAKAAGLAGSDTWRKYPKAMLYSRCMSAGARIEMPDVIEGMYTPEELADPDTLTVDESTGEIIEGTDHTVPQVAPAPTPTPTPATTNGNGKARPFPPDGLRGALAAKARTYGNLADKRPNDGQRGLMVGQLGKLTGDGSKETIEQTRHLFLESMFGKQSSTDLSEAECRAVLDWIAYDADMAAREMASVVAAALRAAGQAEFEIPDDNDEAA